MVLTVSSDYLINQYFPVDFCNGEMQCFVWDTNYFLKYYYDDEIYILSKAYGIDIKET
jgi:hypothetical protein